MPESEPGLAREWSDLHFRAPITRQPRRRWRPAVALVVLLLRFALLTGLLLHRVQIPAAQEQRIEVSFIERAGCPCLRSSCRCSRP